MPDPIEASWLAVRRAADERARLASLPLVARLAAHLAAHDGESPGQISSPGRAADATRGVPRRVAFVDVGAGTGANQEWLGPAMHAHLGSGWTQEWHLLDHDASLLAAAAPSTASWLADNHRHVGGVETVAAVLKQLTRPRVMTCSALLDLMSAAQIETLVQASVTTSQAALWSLSVTGEVVLEPVNPHDQKVADLFNRHQRGGDDRDSTLGPDAWEHAQRAFVAAGWHAEVTHTPWHLGPGDEALTRRLLTERAAAARQATDDAASLRRVDGWLATRLADIDAGELRVSVDHVDVLALPASVISVQMSSPSA